MRNIYNELEKINEFELLEYLNKLDDSKKSKLLKSIEKIDFEKLGKLVTYDKEYEKLELSKVSCISGVKSFESNEKYKYEFEKLAIVILAGGKGSRLGFDGPKGVYELGQTKTSLFHLHFKNIKKKVKNEKYFDVYIMTSEENHAATLEYFEKKEYFNYPEDKIHFFKQAMLPTLNEKNKIQLSDECSISFSADGTGGWWKSLKSAIPNINKHMWFNVVSVDNVLQNIADYSFFKCTLENQSELGAKVIIKNDIKENVGTICRYGEKAKVIEYIVFNELVDSSGSDLSKISNYGVTLNYLFSHIMLDKISELPFYVAKKKNRVFNYKKMQYESILTNKYETILVDMIEYSNNTTVYVIEREREFAPIKNLSGIDSVESALELLELNHIEV